jgi:hypothetical protein
MLSFSVFRTIFFPIPKNEYVTRMLLHAIHADTRFGDMNVKGRIIIKSPDTDVLLLCIHFFPSMRNIKELWFAIFQSMFSFLFQKMSMWCRNLLKHVLQTITCIQDDPGYGKYHGLEDSEPEFF